MPRKPALLKKMSPAAQLGSAGSQSSAPTMASNPRGSSSAKARTWSNRSANRLRRSASGPFPSAGPPSTISLVGSPSVWESMTRMGVLLPCPGGVPTVEQLELRPRKLSLRRAQLVRRIEMKRVFALALQRHQIFVEEDEI